MGKFFLVLALATVAVADIGNCNAIFRNTQNSKSARCAYTKYADSTIRAKADRTSIAVDGLVCDYFDKCNFTCSFSNELQQMSEPDIETYLLGFNFSQKEVRYLLEINKGYRKCKK